MVDWLSLQSKRTEFPSWKILEGICPTIEWKIYTTSIMPLVCCICQILKVFKHKETNTDGGNIRSKIGCVVDLTTRKQEKNCERSEKLHVQPVGYVNLG